MSDYELTLVVRNARLRALMLERGITTAAELSRQSGVSQTNIGDILNLKTTCYNKNMEPRSFVVKLADFFGCLPDEMFPEENLFEVLPQNRFVATVESSNMKMLANQVTADPATLLEYIDSREGEKLKAIYGSKYLSLREKRVIEKRFYENKTFNEISEELDITRERVRQVEINALRKMRHPSKSELIEKLGGEPKPQKKRKPISPPPRLWKYMIAPRIPPVPGCPHEPLKESS